MATSKNLKANQGNATLFPVDSLVNPLVMQEKDREKQITVSSGLRCLELLQRLNRPGLLAKTLLDSYRWRMAKHLTGYSLRWKLKGTRSNHLLYQLAVSGRGTEEIEFGLLPTPVAQEGPGMAQMKLTDAIEIMEGRIPKYYKMFPTPTTRDYKGTGNVERIRDGEIQKDTLDRIVEPGNPGQLNPNWVEWLMGYPTGWTDLKD